MNQPLILVADIGATHARFALASRGGQTLAAQQVLLCADFAEFSDAITHYYSAVDIADPGRRPRQAAIAIATPVTGDKIAMTNHPWSFSIALLERQLGLQRLIVLNDFTALALSLPVLDSAELRKMGGEAPAANAPLALIGPGSGLGVSGLVPSAGGWAALQSEGGHASFSPMNERESDILVVLRRRYGHVSAERVLSGPGLINLYGAIAELAGRPAEPLTPAQITERGIANTCALCAETLDIFCAALGSAAGNLVLTLGARGGVYIGGGIAPKLGDYLAASPFRSRFEDKGRFSAYLAAIPCYVILSDSAALRGAAQALEPVKDGVPHTPATGIQSHQ